MIKSKEFHDSSCEENKLTSGLPFKRKPIVTTVLTTVLALTLATIHVTYVQAQTGFWSLGVTVDNIPRSVDTVIVTVKGPFNDNIYKAIDASTSDSIYTTFYVSTDKIPDGYNYKVCVHGAGDSLDWCQSFQHNGGSFGNVRVTYP